MNEPGFASVLTKRLKKELKDYTVSQGEALIYRVIVDEKGEFKPDDPLRPRRGNLAFQTDVLIKKGNLPLVVIETKWGGFSTHDVLTYSTKAMKHKEVYPYVRYGLVVGKEKVISNKFFTHNLGFDFALAIDNVRNLSTFIRIIKEQVKNSELMLNVLTNKNKTKFFSTKLKIRNV